MATADGFVAGIEPADRRNDSGLAADTLQQVRRRRGRHPARLMRRR